MGLLCKFLKKKRQAISVGIALLWLCFWDVFVLGLNVYQEFYYHWASIFLYYFFAYFTFTKEKYFDRKVLVMFILGSIPIYFTYGLIVHVIIYYIVAGNLLIILYWMPKHSRMTTFVVFLSILLFLTVFSDPDISCFSDVDDSDL